MVGSRSSRDVNSSSACAGCGLAPSPPAMNTRKPGSTRAVGERAVHRDHADVVEHRLAAVGGAAREVDLELAGQALRDRVAQEQVLRGLGPRADVEHLVGARAGEVAAGDVADGVAARFAAREPDRREQPEHLGGLLELDEVELHVLAGGEVTPATRVGLGDVAEHLELVGLDPPVGDLHPDHLVVAALALAVDALVQAEDPEDVVVDLAGHVPPGAVLEVARAPPRSRGRGAGRAALARRSPYLRKLLGFSTRNASEKVGNFSDRTHS